MITAMKSLAVDRYFWMPTNQCARDSFTHALENKIKKKEIVECGNIDTDNATGLALVCDCVTRFYAFYFTVARKIM